MWRTALEGSSFVVQLLRDAARAVIGGEPAGIAIENNKRRGKVVERLSASQRRQAGSAVLRMRRQPKNGGAGRQAHSGSF